MSEQLFQRGSLTITRGAFRCDSCDIVKRGTQRHSQTGWVSICDDCEEECRESMKPFPLLINSRTPGAGIDEISSRQVSEWLEHLCCILEGEVAKLEALGVATFSENFNWLGECRRTAQWLWDAKFYIRDTWRLRVAVNELFKAWDRGGFTNVAQTQELMGMLFQAFEPFKRGL